jgi:hypothetical protein
MLSEVLGTGIQIPEGKKVKFFIDSVPELATHTFFLEQDISVKLTSTYEQLVSAGIGKVGTALTDWINTSFDINLPSAGFKQLGFQQWTGTKPLAFNFEVKKFMENNAHDDVITPCKILMKLPVPTQTGDKGGLIAPGPTALDIILKRGNKVANKNALSIQLGSIYIEDCVIQGVEATFSQETDQTGSPIWASLRIDCMTMFTANDKMIESLFSGPLSFSSDFY